MENSILYNYLEKIKDNSWYIYNSFIIRTVKIYTYFSLYFENEQQVESDNQISQTDYNKEHNIIKIVYKIQDVEYILVSPIFHNIDERYIKLLLKSKNPEKYILSALINDNIDVTELLNKLCGPYGTFYYPIICMKLKWIIPEIHINDFKTLSIVDNQGDDYLYTNLNDVLSLNRECNLIPYINEYEKEKLIKKSPYI